ncbi:unnamed protein product [Prorocentrum cordatum]|uniref:UspA domain-containing protein n=1 Tax=Prorocentrum cordatum TaxID=2364126 RepID=A0ABN9SIZ3_9DINO|nr:unnamed protein product [Polarella glacialis]
MLAAARVLRAAKTVVGISYKDVAGGKAAMKKAVQWAQPSDTIVALSIPKLVPEMMLSSMSDPADADESTFEALANLPSKVSASMQQQLQEVAAQEMEALGKKVEIKYKVLPPSNDPKASMVQACSAEKASMLVVGPGMTGNGSFAAYMVSNAKGITVCAVRDHVV